MPFVCYSVRKSIAKTRSLWQLVPYPCCLDSLSAPVIVWNVPPLIALNRPHDADAFNALSNPFNHPRFRYHPLP